MFIVYLLFLIRESVDSLIRPYQVLYCDFPVLWKFKFILLNIQAFTYFNLNLVVIVNWFKIVSPVIVLSVSQLDRCHHHHKSLIKPPFINFILNENKIIMSFTKQYNAALICESYVSCQEIYAPATFN